MSESIVKIFEKIWSSADKLEDIEQGLVCIAAGIGGLAGATATGVATYNTVTSTTNISVAGAKITLSKGVAVTSSAAGGLVVGAAGVGLITYGVIKVIKGLKSAKELEEEKQKLQSMAEEVLEDLDADNKNIITELEENGQSHLAETVKRTVFCHKKGLIDNKTFVKKMKEFAEIYIGDFQMSHPDYICENPDLTESLRSNQSSES